MSYPPQPPPVAAQPVMSPAARPPAVTAASLLLWAMAAAGLIYAISTLVIVPGTVGRFRSVATRDDPEMYVAVIWLGAAVALVLAVIVVAVFAVLGVALRRGSTAGRITTLVVCGLGVLTGAASALIVAAQRSGDPVAGSMGGQLSSAYPAGWISTNVGLAVAQMIGYLLVGALVLAAPKSFFRRTAASAPARQQPAYGLPYPGGQGCSAVSVQGARPFSGPGAQPVPGQGFSPVPGQGAQPVPGYPQVPGQGYPQVPGLGYAGSGQGHQPVPGPGHAGPGGYGPPPGYGLPPGYGPPSGYGLPPGYGPPSGYGLPPGYGPPPGFPYGPPGDSAYARPSGSDPVADSLYARPPGPPGDSVAQAGPGGGSPAGSAETFVTMPSEVDAASTAARAADLSAAPARSAGELSGDAEPTATVEAVVELAKRPPNGQLDEYWSRPSE